MLSSFAQEAANYFLHTIQKGENLYTIASMYNVSQEDIVKLNPGADRVIFTGKALKIPQVKAQSSDDELFYTIKPGDTLYRLSVNYKVSTQAIMKANPGLSAQNFRIGQVIRIPQVSEQEIQQEIAKRTQEETQKLEVRPAVKSRCREMHKLNAVRLFIALVRPMALLKTNLLLQTQNSPKG